MGRADRPDRYAELRCGAGTATKSLALADAGDGRTPPATLEPPEACHGLGTAHLVTDHAGVSLELTHGGLGGLSEDAVHPSRIETERSQPKLEVRNIIATNHRRPETEQPGAEVVASFDECGPGARIAFSVGIEAGSCLERRNGG